MLIARVPLVTSAAYATLIQQNAPISAQTWHVGPVHHRNVPATSAAKPGAVELHGRDDQADGQSDRGAANVSRGSEQKIVFVLGTISN